MKTIIFSIIGLFLLPGVQAEAQYEWTDIQYHFQTGSVPPPYYYEYDIYISATGTGSLAYHGGYESDTSKKDYTYDFNVLPDDLKSLDQRIQTSKVLTDAFEELEKHPIGGSINRVFITMPQDPRIDHRPPRIETPYFPKSKKQKAALEKLYAKIKSLVPQSVWDDIESRKNK